MRHLIILMLTCVLILPAAAQRSAEEIIAKVNENFRQIKDASADITLEYNLHLFGCAGRRVIKGQGYYKYPDKIKSKMDGITYFVRGNRIRKIDEKGRRFYVKLLNALDFTPGFHAGLIPHNFHLKVYKDNQDEIVIEGLPKPGVLKHVQRILFHIDPDSYLIKKMDLTLPKRSLSGTIFIDYEKIDGLTVPVGFHGRTAIEITRNVLVGLGIKLKGENIKVNRGLSDKLFNPGF